MKALVTGSAGFIGSTLAARLLSEGHSVVGVDSFTDYYDPSFKRANTARLSSPNFTLVEADLLRMDLEPLLDGVDVVFHQAGQPGVRASWGADFRTYSDSNINVTQRLLEAARQLGTLERFVYASSSSVYGNAERYPTQEGDTPLPVSPYGVSKLAGEHLCTLYASNFGLKTVSLRYFTVYGPRQRPDMAFTRFVRAAIAGETIRIFGSGEQIRDFTYVDDIVHANLLAATVPLAPGAVLNVSGGSSISVNGVLELLAPLVGRPLDIEYVAAVAGDVARTGGDARLITQLLHWDPLVDIREGLGEQLAWATSDFWR